MKKLLILGAGYGGLAVAQKYSQLARGKGNWQITLVDQRDYHLIQVRVHEVAANTLPADKVRIPLGELLEGYDVNYVQAKIEQIKPASNEVVLNTGTLTYDRLVVALGSETFYPNVPGLREHAYPMKHLEDAIAYRKAVIQAFKNATDHDAAPLTKNDPRLTFTIIGAGLTGTELAGEMVDFTRELSKRYPVPANAIKIALVDAADRILPGLELNSSEYVRDELRQRGIAVLTSRPITKLEPGLVFLEGDKVIKSEVVCWAGGIKAPGIIKESGFETVKGGRVAVDNYLRSSQYPNVYLIGDNALVTDPRDKQPVAQTGQYAERQGHYVGESLYDEETGAATKIYTPFSLGTAISIGRGEALTITGPLRLTGLPGRLAKDASYAKYEFDIRVKPRVLGAI